MLGKGDRLTTPEISALCLSSEQGAVSILSVPPALCPSPDLKDQLLREQLPHPSRPSIPLKLHPLGWSKECFLDFESVSGTPANEEMDDDLPCNSALCCTVSQPWWGCGCAGQLHKDVASSFPGQATHLEVSLHLFLSYLQSSPSEERKKGNPVGAQ